MARPVGRASTDSLSAGGRKTLAGHRRRRPGESGLPSPDFGPAGLPPGYVNPVARMQRSEIRGNAATAIPGEGA